MRGTWRGGNAWRWLRDGRRQRVRAQVLAGTWRWYLALAATLVGLPAPAALRLRGGGHIGVREFMTLVIFDEVFVQRCYDLAPAARVGAPVIVDVGANTGLYALWAVHEYAPAAVHCYEPYPPNHARAQHTLAGLDGVSLWAEAVGAEARTAALHVHPRNIGGHSLMPALAGSRTVTVPVVALTAVLDRLPGGRCDLLKLDCEGAEVEILGALTPALAQRIGALVCELTPALTDWDAVEARLTGFGYRTDRQAKLLRAWRQAA